MLSIFRSNNFKNKISKIHIGLKRSEECRKRISISRKKRFKTFGYLNSSETRRKISLANKGRKPEEETRQRMSLAQKGKKRGKSNPSKRKNVRNKLSLATKRYWKNLPKFNKDIRAKKVSVFQKKLWKTQEYKEKQLKRMRQKYTPSKLEQKFDIFFKQNNLPFNYCGNGSIIIGGKIPDFICNPLKLVVEVGSKKEKDFRAIQHNKYNNWQNYERKRKAHFKRYFFDCICLWEDELKYPFKILNKIRRFI
jgi:very-short-patch-repair endonuclease